MMADGLVRRRGPVDESLIKIFEDMGARTPLVPMGKVPQRKGTVTFEGVDLSIEGLRDEEDGSLSIEIENGEASCRFELDIDGCLKYFISSQLGIGNGIDCQNNTDIATVYNHILAHQDDKLYIRLAQHLLNNLGVFNDLAEDKTPVL